MYMRESSAEAAVAAPVGFPLAVNFVLAFTVAGTLYFGLFPNQVLNFILQPTLLGRYAGRTPAADLQCGSLPAAGSLTPAFLFQCIQFRLQLTHNLSTQNLS